MKFWLGVTDNQWYEFVSGRAFDEVNFWQPSARAPFTNLPAGTPFFFKLKRPNNHIVGGGFFSHFTTLPLSQAWDFFGEENGASSFRQFAELIAFNAHATASAERQIGCTVVSDVFYLPREAWIPVEGLFPKPIMVGKQYDSSEELGATLWQRIQSALPLAVSAQVVGEEDAPRYGAEFLQRGRLGQGAFRTLVLDAYARRCALTGESTLPVLEAAHIRPYADQGRHLISNGLLLRSDFHKLFDLGLVTVQPDYRIRISSRIRDQYFNGKAYYRLDGQELALLPERLVDRPDREALRWHNENRFMS
ncbi:MAG: HNH endonuclease [Xanthomonadaceae bacterium]|jgi:putative restriction endonuclease|nr:HNH endonuclease [Xanthomonadaceae bacterium]